MLPRTMWRHGCRCPLRTANEAYPLVVSRQLRALPPPLLTLPPGGDMLFVLLSPVRGGAVLLLATFYTARVMIPAVSIEPLSAVTPPHAPVLSVLVQKE